MTYPRAAIIRCAAADSSLFADTGGGAIAVSGIFAEGLVAVGRRSMNGPDSEEAPEFVFSSAKMSACPAHPQKWNTMVWQRTNMNGWN